MLNNNNILSKQTEVIGYAVIQDTVQEAELQQHLFM